MIAIAALAGVAVAEVENSHVLTIRLPDGTQEQIRYVGDHPPEVRLKPAERAAFFPLTDWFGPDSPFAELDRISTEMDREAATMLQQVRGLPDPLFDDQGGVMRVDLDSLQPSVHGYRVVSTLSSGGVCTRMTQYRSDASAGQPKVLTRTSGNCGPDQRSAASAAGDRAASQGALSVSYTPSPPTADLSRILNVSATN